jgi:hypothetical protein
MSQMIPAWQAGYCAAFELETETVTVTETSTGIGRLFQYAPPVPKRYKL